MKINVLLGLIALFLGYVTCKTFSKPDPAATVPAEAAPAAAPAPGTDTREAAQRMGVAAILGSNADTAAPVQFRHAPLFVEVPVDAVAKPTASRKAFLATGWWHCNMAYSGIDSTIHHNYQSKWLKFREDQTFDLMIKGQVVESGRWAFDETKSQIYLSCKDTYINNTWTVQEKGFVMILKGNTELNFTGIQVRMACNKTKPNWD